MRLSVWSHDTNPAVDPRLTKLPFFRCEQDVRDGYLRWLDPSDKTKGCMTVRVGAAAGDREETEKRQSFAAHELSSETTLTERVVLANVGLAKRRDAFLTENAVIRAKAKVKYWMSPLTADSCAPLPRGAWADMSRLEVCATP